MYEIEIPDSMQDKLPWTYASFVDRSHFLIFKKMLYNIIEEQQPMTVRQVFYRAVVKNWVEKTERGYGKVQRDLVEMRKSGMLPYEWIVDESRRMRGWQGSDFQSVDEFIEEFDKEAIIDKIASGYFISLLGTHDFSIQIWLEKEALLGIFEPVTRRWGVALCPAKGYSSLSFMKQAAEDLEAKGRPAKIFHFGDYDPSGQNAIEVVQRDLPELAPITTRLGIEFQTVALNLEQIAEMNLPTRPTKKSDPRASTFGDESVELDAIEPDVLRQMVEDTIAGCFPEGARDAIGQQMQQGREEIRRRLGEMLG